MLNEMKDEPELERLIGPCYTKSFGLSLADGFVEIAIREIILVKNEPALVEDVPFTGLLLPDGQCLTKQRQRALALSDRLHLGGCQERKELKYSGSVF